MLDRIFNFISNLAKKASEKNVIGTSYNYRNKLFTGIIILMGIYNGITTYQVGECVNCLGELTGEEAAKMIKNGTPQNNELTQWYMNRTYVPFTSFGKFVKQWLINTTGPVVIFSLIFFSLYFIWNIIDNKIKQFKNKKITDILGVFGNNINKK